jgi:hypothetical protein
LAIAAGARATDRASIAMVIPAALKRLQLIVPPQVRWQSWYSKVTALVVGFKAIKDYIYLYYCQVVDIRFSTDRRRCTCETP